MLGDSTSRGLPYKIRFSLGRIEEGLICLREGSDRSSDSSTECAYSEVIAAREAVIGPRWDALAGRGSSLRGIKAAQRRGAGAPRFHKD